MYLKECLNSLINQSLKNIEIICINDGSTDNSLEIILEYMHDNRFIIINKKNSGYGDSMNKGIEFVTGEYIGIVESDDFADFNMFEILYKNIKNGEIDIVRSNYKLFWEGEKKEIVDFYFMKPFYNKIFNPIENPMIFLIPPSIWAGIYKKELLIKNKIKFLTTPGASYQDTSFFFKTLFKSKKIFFLDKAFINYRQTNLNSSVNNNSIDKAMFVHKEYSEFENYSKNDKNLFKKIEKIYNTKKFYSLLWNLERVDKKKEYIKIIYHYIYNILKNENYLVNQFNKKEKKFFNNLRDYGYKITYEIYINSLKFNETNPKISVIISKTSENLNEECLNSLIQQTFKNFEIILINDNLSENILKKIKKFEERDERIHIFKNINKNLTKNINFAIKKSKGNYLIFLNLNDCFENSMIEELFTKIILNDDEIVIFNSNEFEIENNKRKIIKEKNFLIIDNKFLKNSFTIFDIKKGFFNLLFLYPFDKIIKKEFIENLMNKKKLFFNFDELNFITSIVFEANKISFLDKVLINHRIEKNLIISNSNELNLEIFYSSLQNFKILLKEKNIYKKFKQDFINFVATYSIYKLENINGKSFCFLFQKLKNEYWNEFEITKYNKNYFYDKNIYKKIKNILESELEIFSILNQLNGKDEKINYLKEQKIFCVHKILVAIQTSFKKKYLINIIKYTINKILYIYFFIINFMIL